MKKSKLTFDGSYLGNGRGLFAFVFDGHSKAGELQCYSNVEAEYQALIKGLHHAISVGVEDLTIYGDSKTVLHQITGQIRTIKTKKLLAETRELLSTIPHYTVEWIPRAKNIAHDKLPN